MMRFKHWLEEVESDEDNIKRDAIMAAKNHGKLPKDMPDDEVLKSPLKTLDPIILKALIDSSDQRSDTDRSAKHKAILEKIRDDNTAEFTVQDLVNELLSTEDDKSLKSDQKTYSPKTPGPAQNTASPPAPQAGPPPGGPAMQPPAAPMAIPAQSMS